MKLLLLTLFFLPFISACQSTHEISFKLDNQVNCNLSPIICLDSVSSDIKNLVVKQKGYTDFGYLSLDIQFSLNDDAVIHDLFFKTLWPSGSCQYFKIKFPKRKIQKGSWIALITLSDSVIDFSGI